MQRSLTLGLIFALAVAGAAVASAAAKDEAPREVTIDVDTTASPDSAEWAAKAQQLCREWYPKLVEELDSPGFKPYPSAKLVFKSDPKGVGGAAGSTIFVSAEWIKKHPDDFGMVIHELVHVVQAYPKYDPPWLVEGIADYERLYKFEPKTSRPQINVDKASYRDGYRTTAAFLDWASRTYDAEIVSKLNAALRKTEYSEALWEKSTGKTLDVLWAEFLASQKKK